MKVYTDLSGSNTDQTWNAQAQQTTILNTANQQYPRNITLSTQGVRVNRLGVAVGFSIDALIAAAVALEPTLTWPPKITTQPANGTTHTAGPASFNVVVNSEISVTYQWQSNNGGGWGNLSNAGVYSNVDTATMNISNSIGLNGYQFRCVITNASGVTTSSAATLTVDPDVVSGPADLTVTAPAVATFTIVSSGTPSLTYQWQVSTDGGSTWSSATGGVYTGDTTTTLTITNSTGLNGNKYRCTVIGLGTIHSNAATLTVL